LSGRRRHQLKSKVGFGVRLAILAMAGLFAASAVAQTAPQDYILTPTQAVTQDASIYAQQYAVSLAEASRRLRVQEASIPATDRIAAEFEQRLAGISIEHSPEYRIVVLLTGDAPVADRVLNVAGSEVPVVFRTGAVATHAQAIAAMRRHLIDLRSELPGARGAGYDQRTGEVVLLVRSEDAAQYGLAAIKARAEQIGGVPVRVVVNDLRESNMAVAGGGLVDGLGADGRHYRCTTAFVVTDGTRDAIATAAHCPDELVYRDSDGGPVPLAFVSQDGVGYRDVQINLTPQPEPPLFYSDRKGGSLRELTSWRNVASTRAGDFVCHWGESSGYTCAEVELTDYAPPGALCGGPCEPTWVTVPGPGCVAGDSGGPVFSGTTAFGIAKGINRTASGRCNFYYYMSTDYLPSPWQLSVAKSPLPHKRRLPVPASGAIYQHLAVEPRR
jgi:streptogrisin C